MRGSRITRRPSSIEVEAKAMSAGRLRASHVATTPARTMAVAISGRPNFSQRTRREWVRARLNASAGRSAALPMASSSRVVIAWPSCLLGASRMNAAPKRFAWKCGAAPAGAHRPLPLCGI
jgi:hypothetical protein